MNVNAVIAELSSPHDPTLAAQYQAIEDNGLLVVDYVETPHPDTGRISTHIATDQKAEALHALMAGHSMTLPLSGPYIETFFGLHQRIPEAEVFAWLGSANAQDQYYWGLWQGGLNSGRDVDTRNAWMQSALVHLSRTGGPLSAATQAALLPPDTQEVPYLTAAKLRGLTAEQMKMARLRRHLDAAEGQ